MRRLPDEVELGIACDCLKDRGLDEMADLFLELVAGERRWPRWSPGGWARAGVVAAILRDTFDSEGFRGDLGDSPLYGEFRAWIEGVPRLMRGLRIRIRQSLHHQITVCMSVMVAGREIGHQEVISLAYPPSIGLDRCYDRLVDAVVPNLEFV